MKYSLTILSIILLLIVGSSVNALAQKKKKKRKFNPKHRFNAGFVLGITASQIDGDGFSGYHKLGIQGGVRGIAKLTRYTDLAVEMLFLQKGSRDPNSSVGKEYRKLTLNYIEVPVFLHLKTGEEGFRGSVDLGFSFGRLLNYDIVEYTNRLKYTPFESVKDEFKRNDWSLVIGGGFFYSDHLKFQIRHSIGLTRFYDNVDYDITSASVLGPKDFRLLRNYFLSVNTTYMF